MGFNLIGLCDVRFRVTRMWLLQWIGEFVCGDTMSRSVVVKNAKSFRQEAISTATSEYFGDHFQKIDH